MTVLRAILALVVCLPVAAQDNVLHPGQATLDRPTLTALGIRLPVTGDDNFNASVAVQYRTRLQRGWSDALPLYRVHPEVYTAPPAGLTIMAEFAGSIMDLEPDTTYEIRLRITDPDGAEQVQELTGTTRPVPRGPKRPNLRVVSDSAGLTSALASAQPGDVILLAPGQYPGQFVISASGAAEQPIVIRGAVRPWTVLDGQGCAECFVLQVSGSYVHVENLTIRNAARGIVFLNPATGIPTTGNVVRRVHIDGTIIGMRGVRGQTDFYIADNVLEGRLRWPLVFRDDGGLHSDDDGIRVVGQGHVVAHNRISGYGDAMSTFRAPNQPGSRAVDFYGNDILWTYDNGVELDESEGNVRCLRNRFTNTFTPISTQPVYGGPAYIIRNIAVNVADEQLKFKALAITPPQEPAGMLVYHNTFVSPGLALNLQTPRTSHYFVLANNLFVGPDPLPQPGGCAVDWTSPNHGGTFDYNGYVPDGKFGLAVPNCTLFANLAAVQAQLGLETHGMIVEPRCDNGSPFASCLTPPASYTELLPPADPRSLRLRPDSNAVDSGLPLPSVNSDFRGEGPELGAVESGCTSRPWYGPRPLGIDERHQRTGCR